MLLKREVYAENSNVGKQSMLTHPTKRKIYLVDPCELWCLTLKKKKTKLMRILYGSSANTVQTPTDTVHSRPDTDGHITAS